LLCQRDDCGPPPSQSGGSPATALQSFAKYAATFSSLTGQSHKLCRDRRAAGFAIEIEGVGPGDDGAFVSETAEIGERGSQKCGAAAASAMLARDAGRAEEAEAAVVGVVRGEAGDFAVDIDVEEVVSGVRCFESPDAAEFFFDEGEDAVAGRGRNASGEWGVGGWGVGETSRH
jgi:hypothetical protein